MVRIGRQQQHSKREMEDYAQSIPAENAFGRLDASTTTRMSPGSALIVSNKRPYAVQNLHATIASYQYPLSLDFALTLR